MEIVNAALPSKVLNVEDDHRCFPTRLPTIDAYCNHRQLYVGQFPSQQTHQSISNPNRKDTRELEKLSGANIGFSQY